MDTLLFNTYDIWCFINFIGLYLIMRKLKIILLSPVLTLVASCATLTNDAMIPVALSFSDGSNGSCKLYNKRGSWVTPIPETYMVRRSDDPLRYDCETKDGRTAFGSIPSTVGSKIVASAVFLDFGITDAITDKHREYPSSYVIPMRANE